MWAENLIKMTMNQLNRFLREMQAVLNAVQPFPACAVLL